MKKVSRGHPNCFTFHSIYNCLIICIFLVLIEKREQEAAIKMFDSDSEDEEKGTASIL